MSFQDFITRHTCKLIKARMLKPCGNIQLAQMWSCQTNEERCATDPVGPYFSSQRSALSMSMPDDSDNSSRRVLRLRAVYTEGSVEFPNSWPQSAPNHIPSLILVHTHMKRVSDAPGSEQLTMEHSPFSPGCNFLILTDDSEYWVVTQKVLS